MKYRKKQVVIEAHQLPPVETDPTEELVQFLAASDRPITSEGDGTLAITTLEGVMTAGPGDWIIRGVKGEYYPCKDDIFRATYEPVMPESQETQDLNNRIVKRLVEKFLCWPLPESVCADGCASIKGYKMRSGTNLLTYTEAEQMIRHLIGPALNSDALSEAEADCYMRGFFDGQDAFERSRNEGIDI